MEAHVTRGIPKGLVAEVVLDSAWLIGVGYSGGVRMRRVDAYDQTLAPTTPTPARAPAGGSA